MQRLYDVEPSGSITIDGEPIARYDVHHLRRNIGVVSQDNVLFSASIKDNICYGMGQGHLPVPTDEDVARVCDKANAAEFIDEFPNGLHTRIGEKGVRLSGGQRQRIAIARAMIRSPTILLLDEQVDPFSICGAVHLANPGITVAGRRRPSTPPARRWCRRRWTRC